MAQSGTSATTQRGLTEFYCPFNFIAQNLMQSMCWVQQLQQNAPKYQLKRFVKFKSFRVINSDLNRMVARLNICNKLVRFESLKFHLSALSTVT